MYTQEDLLLAKKQLRRFTLFYILLATVLAAGIVVSCVLRIAWLGYSATILLTATSVFLWGTAGMTFSQYVVFLQEILQSRNRYVNGAVEHIEVEKSGKKGLEFYGVYIRREDMPESAPPMLVYYDARKGEPPFTEGENVRLTLYDKYIKAV